MNIVGTMLARNEDWIIGLSARSALQWCDHLIVFNHASTDDTAEIVMDVAVEHPGRVTLMAECDPVWKEMEYRQRMLDKARELKASHIAVVDADEVLSGNLIDALPPAIKNLSAHDSLEPPWVGLRGSIHRYHTDGVWGTNWVSTAFLDRPQLFWKSRNGYDFHHRRPMGEQLISNRPWEQGDGGLMHLQFVSDRRLRAKQACYKMQEVLRWPGREQVSVIDQRYNRAVYESGSFSSTPATWWAPYRQWMQYLRVDSEPWQERQCKEWMDEHGAARFKGLDLFGVV